MQEFFSRINAGNPSTFHHKHDRSNRRRNSSGNAMEYLTILTICALAASARAIKLLGASATPIVVEEPADHNSPAHYAYNYAVNDPQSGDNKAQWEKREGDVVKGSYSLVEPDGNLRVVDYTADAHTGFNAIVKRLESNLHPGPPAKAAESARGPQQFPGAAKQTEPAKITTTKWGSPAWDDKTESYDGWVPLKGKRLAPGGYVKITALKNGKKVWSSGPVKVEKGKNIIVKTKSAKR